MRATLVIGCLALLITAGPAAAAPAAVTLSAEAAGRPVREVLTGQHWILAGTTAPSTTAVAVEVRRRGRVVLSRQVAVQAGAFRLPLRFVRPGRLAIAVSTPGGSGTLDLPVRGVGHRRPGCGYAPEVAAQRGASANRRDLRPDVRLATGARIAVAPGGVLRLRAPRAETVLAPGRYVVDCQALRVVRGRAALRAHRRAGLLIGSALAVVRPRGRAAASTAPAAFAYARGNGFVASSRAPTVRVRTVGGDRVLLGPGGVPRMDTWPFAQSPEQRRARRSDRLPAFWADGRPCSTGCRPRGARTGWPLKPFHAQHALRAGLNEYRPANFHIGIDIMGRFNQRVYALQGGTASIADRGSSDEHVAVGRYEYWHVRPAVRAGASVRRGQVVGRILRAERHVHLSELQGGAYLNPLRPGGRVLRPWSDTEPPIIGRPRRAGASVLAEVFDPQSFRTTIYYRTPVLAPAAVAWRARDRRGRAITRLRFAYRGSQHYPTPAKGAVFGPGTHEAFNPSVGPPGGLCFDRALVCITKHVYRLSGVPRTAASLTVYAWDWDGNASVRTSRL